jgi:hypothetical protein
VVSRPMKGMEWWYAPGRVGGQEKEGVIAAEAHPREEEQEPGDQPHRATAVGRLLREKIGVAHAPGAREDRSTVGTARSPASAMTQRSAGVAFAMPATRLVGNCCCAVLYSVATSL